MSTVCLPPSWCSGNLQHSLKRRFAPGVLLMSSAALLTIRALVGTRARLRFGCNWSYLLAITYVVFCRFFAIKQGHSDGGKKLGDFLEWCMEAGVAMATAFAFSTENWKRDAHEVC